MINKYGYCWKVQLCIGPAEGVKFDSPDLTPSTNSGRLESHGEATHRRVVGYTPRSPLLGGVGWKKAEN